MMSRSEAASQFFHEGYNCAQSVALAFSDVFEQKAGISRESLLALSSGFGGGIARQREVCGCVSGMTLVLGVLYPAGTDKEGRARNYERVQCLCGRFREACGSIVCRDLLGLGKSSAPESPVPSERTPAFYHSRKCADLVALAASLLEEEL